MADFTEVVPWVTTHVEALPAGWKVSSHTSGSQSLPSCGLENLCRNEWRALPNALFEIRCAHAVAEKAHPGQSA